MITIYDKKIEHIERQLAEAKRRYLEFVEPLRKQRNNLNTMRKRAVKSGDTGKMVIPGVPDHEHLIPNKVRQQMAALSSGAPTVPPVAPSMHPTAEPSAPRAVDDEGCPYGEMDDYDYEGP